MNSIRLALDALLTRYINLFKTENDYGLPSAEFDSPWPSPCIEKQVDDIAYWRHQDKTETNLFKDIESALEVTLHQDIKEFYGSFWSNGICVQHEDIDFSLIQAWNAEDQETLRENIFGHCFAKLKGRLPLTLFIGCTQSNEVVCLDNESGEVVLERPGKKAHKILAGDLESFLLSLSPSTDTYNL
jgi:SecY interacting protein Syd